jgi:pyruvate dehydrogenase E2 component (dihydrolipoamide acetyltransferase)
MPAPPVATLPGAAPAAAPGRVRASPAARRLAAERGIDLAPLAGSGPGGAVISTDLARVEEPAATGPPRAAGFDLAEMRKAIAAAMARSKREIPHYYLETRLDLESAAAWLAETNATRPPAGRLLLAALLHKAVALALRRFPSFNGFYEHGGFRPAAAIHLGSAIAIRGGGLMAPAIHDADALSLDATMTALRDLVARVRAGRIRGSEMMDPTATVTSLGERGADTVFGVIYPPQVAIIGFGRPAPQLWPAPHGIETRLTVSATLAGDHRVSDGIAGARLLEEIGRLLQEPERL